jgi:hypothetical protein
MIDGQTNLDHQYGDGIEPGDEEEVDDGESQGGLSQMPVAKALEVNLPEVDLGDLANEDRMPDGKIIKW